MNVPSSTRDNFSDLLVKSVFKWGLIILNNYYFYQKCTLRICLFAFFRFISSCFFHIKGNNPLKMNESTFVLLYHLYWEWVQRYQIWQMCRYQAPPSQFFRLESFSIPSSSITNYRRRRRSATPSPRFCYSKIFACLSSHK